MVLLGGNRNHFTELLVPENSNVRSSASNDNFTAQCSDSFTVYLLRFIVDDLAKFVVNVAFRLLVNSDYNIYQ